LAKKLPAIIPASNIINGRITSPLALFKAKIV
jgi:hypothetical protein